MRKIEVAERRTRLARRHRIAPEFRAADVVEATRSMVCLHGTDPATVYLSAWARVHGLDVAQVDRAMYDDRSLVKHLAMRRTLFVFPRDTLSVALGAVGERIAGRERRALIRDVERAGLHADGAAWLASAERAVEDALADGRLATSSELRADLPVLEGSIAFGEGTSWANTAAVGPRVLTVLSADGRVVRTTNGGAWTTSRPVWGSMEHWLGEPVERRPEAESVAELVGGWLETFGPGTVTDIKWWLGSTVAVVRRALADLGAVEVDLGGTTGYLMPDDLDPVESVDPWVALLPPLDPTTMGWFERGWYLGPYKSQLFDTSGNAGPTVWSDGRIVGGWRQDGGGAVEIQLLEDVGADQASAIDAEAARLTEWFAGTRVLPRYPSPLSKELGR